MKANEIREKFLKFFAERGHVEVESSPVVPRDDPTLLFANAGMNQFKNVVVGIDSRPYTRATSCQKCIRAGGKHNDLDNVGVTPRHHTFFEMLGNFSFGDYFKEEAIAFAWELLIEKLGVPREHLWVSVFEEDDETEALWKKFMPASRIVRLGGKDNFWEMGDTGPCGPCSEIHLDLSSFFGSVKPGDAEFNDDLCLEFWNLVFMQFNRQEDGAMEPLPRPCVDTGLGLERIASILQNKHSNYETDLFSPLINDVVALSSVAYTPLECFAGKPMTQKEIEAGMPHRVIADHIRAVAFAIADGAVPSNEGRGYVVRRILRRAARYGRRIGINEPFLTKLLPTLEDTLGDAYPQLRERGDHIADLIQTEEERFASTLETGIELFNNIIEMSPAASKRISGEEAFKLYDTYGFPLDITEDMARERGWTVDTDGFNAALEQQRARARAARTVTGPQLPKVYNELYQEFGDTTFLGYAQLRADSIIFALLDDEGARCDELAEGDEGWIIVDQTPFYGEAGGQESDTGAMFAEGKDALVLDVQRPVHNLFAHHVRVTKGTFYTNDIVVLQTAEENRQATTRHHTAAHLFHAALREVVGKHATQAGSSVNHNRMRFDFHHHTALAPGEIEQIERIVNRVIISDIPVEIAEMSLEDAQETGAIMLFDEKYGAVVRVVSIGDFSCELCGGTHAPRTGCVGSFRIVDESAVAAGVRRVEAVCGMEAFEEMQRKRRLIQETARVLNVNEDDVVDRVDKLIVENKKLRKKLKGARAADVGGCADRALARAKEIAGTTLVVANLGELDAPCLRGVADRIRAKLDSYIIVLGARCDDKCVFVAQVSDDQVAAGRHAGNLLREVAKIAGGGGGGKPTMAQAGGKKPGKLDDALEAVERLLE